MTTSFKPIASKEVEGAVIEVVGKFYHQECFGCHGCGKKLINKCLNVEGFPYCEQCGRKAFIQRKSRPRLDSKPPEEKKTPSQDGDEKKKENEEMQRKLEQDRKAESDRKEKMERERVEKQRIEQERVEKQRMEELKREEEENKKKEEDKRQEEERRQMEDENRKKQELEKQKEVQRKKEEQVQPAESVPSPSTSPPSTSPPSTSPPSISPPSTTPPSASLPSTSPSSASPPSASLPSTSPPSASPPSASSLEDKEFITYNKPLPIPKKKATPVPPPKPAKEEPKREKPPLPAKPVKKMPPPVPKKPTPSSTEAPEREKLPPRIPRKPSRGLDNPNVQEPSNKMEDENRRKKIPPGAFNILQGSSQSQKNERPKSPREETSEAPPRKPSNPFDDPEPEVVEVRTSYRISTAGNESNENLPNLEGYLEKRGDIGVIKSFKRRYFCLKKDRLIYYVDQAEKEKDNPIGYVPLKTAHSFDRDPRRPNTFTIATNEPERLWVLRAESEELMHKWMQAALFHSKWSQEETPQNKSFTTPFTLERKEGFLEKLHGGVSAKMPNLSVKGKNINFSSLRRGEQWRSRWFVLKDGILFKYKSMTDPKPRKIPLYKCTLEEYNPEEGNSTAFQLLFRQKSIVLRAPSVEEMQLWLNAILKHKIMIEHIIDDIAV